MIDLASISQVYSAQTAFLNKVTRFYQNTLKEDPSAYIYVHGDNLELKQRGISSEIASKFKIGYSEDSADLLAFISMNKLPEELLYKTGIFKVQKETVYDYFYDRIIFPFIDLNDNVIGFSGRIWKEKQKDLSKFINSPDTEIYKKSFFWYGLNFAIDEIYRQGYVWIVEGIPDVIACHQAGIYNAVSAGGTYVTEEHLKILKYFTNNIALCFDNDTAGKNALSHIKPLLLSQKLKYKYTFLEKAKDPDALLHNFGISFLLSALTSPF